LFYSFHNCFKGYCSLNRCCAGCRRHHPEALFSLFCYVVTGNRNRVLRISALSFELISSCRTVMSVFETEVKRFKYWHSIRHSGWPRLLWIHNKFSIPEVGGNLLNWDGLHLESNNLVLSPVRWAGVEGRL
jgi:hypothetical protein